jgi:hypothetical protein
MIGCLGQSRAAPSRAAEDSDAVARGRGRGAGRSGGDSRCRPAGHIAALSVEALILLLAAGLGCLAGPTPRRSQAPQAQCAERPTRVDENPANQDRPLRPVQ